MHENKKTEDLPATPKMLNETKLELKHDITSVKIEVKKINTNLDHLRHEFNSQRSDIKKVDAKIESLRRDFNSQRSDIKKINAKLESHQHEFDSIRSEIKKVDSKLEAFKCEIRSIFEQLVSAMHRNNAMVEEQNIRNKYVLDGHVAITARQDTFEQRIDERFEVLEKAVLDKSS